MFSASMTRRRACAILSAAAVASGMLSVAPARAGDRGPASVEALNARVERAGRAAGALRTMGRAVPPRAMRTTAASATLAKICDLGLGKKGGLRWFLAGGTDNIGPYASFQFLDPDQANFFELGQLFADLNKVNIKKLNKCRMEGSGSWGRVNVRTGDAGRKQVAEFGCTRHVWKRMPWSGKVVFKSGTTSLQAGKIKKLSGKLTVLKIVEIDGCVPPPVTDCDLPTQLFAADPGSATAPALQLSSTKDDQGVVDEFLLAAGIDGGLQWFEIVLAFTNDPLALTGDKATMTGQLTGFPPLSGTGTFAGTSSEDFAVECGGTTTVMDGVLSGDLSAQLLMGTFPISGPAAMALHSD